MEETWDEFTEDGIIVDCPSLGIQNAINGLVSVSITVYRKESEGPPYSLDGPGFKLCVGWALLSGWVTSMDVSPNSDTELKEWKVTATAISCRQDVPCGGGC